MDEQTILSERLRRQSLTAPLSDPDGYVELFRGMQPVSPVYYTCPGDPPRLVHRTTFDDGRIADRLRSRGRIVKGRFLGGGIGYVLADELEFYANAFAKPLPGLTEIQRTVLSALRTTGPLTPRQIKDETGLLNKQIMPALHRLQQAFAVFEDQLDSDWERGWSSFESEWPDLAVREAARAGATRSVLRRFLAAHVFATFEQIRDWSGWPVRRLKSTLGELEAAAVVQACRIDGLGEGWTLAEDTLEPPVSAPQLSVFMLHRADLLCRSHASELKRAFGGLAVLQWLLIDGRFRGAVVGHWRIGPHDVDDVVVDLPRPGRAERRDEIIAAVAQQYHAPRSHILRYDGRKITSRHG